MNLRKLLYFILIIPFIMGGSCQKRKFSFVGNTNLIKTVPVDITDSFTESLIIYDSDIRSFLDDLPDDAEVTDVKISSLSLKILPQTNNQAGLISLSATVDDNTSRENLFSVSEYSVPIAGATIPFVGVNSLIEKGLNKTRNKIKRIIMENEFGDLEVIVEGFTNTQGDRLSVNLDIRFAVQIEYDQCIDVWDYLDSGADCDL